MTESQTTSDNSNNSNSGNSEKTEERYEVDSEWLKGKIEGLEQGFSKIVESLALLKPSETKSDSEEPKTEQQTKPSEIQVTQSEGHVDQGNQSQNNRPRSRLTIRGPKM